MGAGVNKVYLTLRGEPVLRHTLRAFEVCDRIDDVIVIAAPAEVKWAQAVIGGWGEISKVRKVVAGGATRQESIRLGIQHLDAACEIVAIHDGARPLICPRTIARVVEAARTFGAAVVAVPVTDTTKSVRDGEVVATLDRESLWAAATPQAFLRQTIEDAHRAAAREGIQATDDSSLVEKTGTRVRVVRGESDNIKITTPEDLIVAEALLGARDSQSTRGAFVEQPRMVDASPSRPLSGLAGAEPWTPERRPGPGRVPAIRVGLGFDVHRLVAGRPLVLAGVEIPFDLGLEGHSDADVILHAIADAILGACGLGDIGHFFPDTDPAFAGISSAVILEKVRDVSSEAGFAVINVDATLVADRPKVSRYIGEMRATVARILRLPVERVGIKATTAEGMGFVGRGEGMACFATCGVWETREPSETGVEG
jgi:2-C-methyl-D-erythritol 4-phosphate cytidylyltransferase/2-C-methyl-D-erythritol 2,4-cyclodiphosphate synthase